MKQGVGALGKGFKKRYFKQSGQAIHYYKDKKDAQDLGKISLAEGECLVVINFRNYWTQDINDTTFKAISVQNVESKDGKFHFQVGLSTRQTP